MNDDTFDRIAVSAPLNATAAKVVGQKGVHFDPQMKPSATDHFESQPPILPLDQIVDMRARSAIQALIGTKFGRFTVIGFAAEQGSWKKNARYVARCVCGRFEYRKAKAIRNPNNADDCCLECRYLAKIVKRQKKRGARPLSEFIGKRDAQ